MKQTQKSYHANQDAEPLPVRSRRLTMSKLSISLAAALALFAATAGVARANSIPTSTDEARAQAGQYVEGLGSPDLYAAAPTNGAITSTDQARAQAGRSLPAESGAWVAPMLAENEDEGRAAAYEGRQVPIEKEPVAVVPAVPGTT